MLASNAREDLIAVTGFPRQSVKDAFFAVKSSFGDRLATMLQRVGGIVVNASTKGGDSGFDDVLAYTDEVVTPVDRSKLYMGLGLTFVGGLLWASTAGKLIVIIVVIICLLSAGMLVKSFYTSLADRASKAIDVF